MKIIALILARGGSKGILHKNIKLLNGKPLLSYVLEEAKKCDFFDGIYVSSDNPNILKVAKEYGVSPWQRPDELATDTARSVDAVNEFLGYHTDIDYVVILNVCCPFTKAEDIANCVKMALETDCDSVVSLVEDFSCHPSKVCCLEKNNRITTNGDFETGERQIQTKVYKRNTAIYLAKQEIIKTGTFFGKKTFGYIMPKNRSWDINDDWDWKIAEFLTK